MKLHKILDRFDHWLHPGYLFSVYFEAHGLYAIMGGVCGSVTLLLAIIEEREHLKGKGGDAEGS